MTTFDLTISTPERTLFAGKVTKVHFTSEMGELEILPHYADFVGAVAYSRVMVHTEEGKNEFVGRRGMFTFDTASNAGSLMLLDCMLTKEFTAVSAEEYIAYLENHMNENELSASQLRFVKEEKYMIEKQVAEMKQES